MRATVNGRHISGAERIAPSEKIDSIAQELIARALRKMNTPEHIMLHIESLRDKPLRSLAALDVVTVNAQDVLAGRSAASRVLGSTGVSMQAVETAIRLLSQGPAPSGGNMRGAIIMDSRTGERLEPDQERGVRVSRFDWSEAALGAIDKKLAEIGLKHFRTREALALATKVVYASGMVAELCWSDEPDYTAGYVASRERGYVRFPMLKQIGDPRGGRVFFVRNDGLNVAALVHYLQNEAVLIDKVGKCCAAIELEAYFNG